MLCNIDEDLIGDARRMLTLLCFASRPLTVPELIDGIAVDIGEPMGLNKNRRLEDYNDIHTICPGLIEIRSTSKPPLNEALKGKESKIKQKEQHTETVLTAQIAHFSVQEYLESERIRNHRAAKFRLTGKQISKHL